MPTPLHNTDGCFHAMMTDLGSCDRDRMACKAENIYYLAHCRNYLLTPTKAFLPRLRIYCYPLPAIRSHNGTTASCPATCVTLESDLTPIGHGFFLFVPYYRADSKF